MSNDIAQIITDRIISELEKGAAPWVKPWKSLRGIPGKGRPYNPVSRTVYRGANFFWLSMQGHEVPWYLTYKQAKSLGGHVKAGEKATPVVYWNIQKKGAIGENGEVCEKSVAFLKSYAVFHIDQCEGITLPPMPVEPEPSFNSSDEVMGLVNRLNLAGGLNHGGDEAFFSPSRDQINMPPMAAFPDSGNYHATLLHEAVHATGHKSRLDRLVPAAFGSENYAYEELVAELGAAMLCQFCGVNGDLRHAGYIQSWLKALRDNKKFILSASAKAQAAMDFLVNGGKVKQESTEELPLAA